MTKKLLKIAIAIILLSLFISHALAFNEEWVIYNEIDNYKGAKYEPTDGLYLGAYILQDTTIDGSIEEFNNLTGKNHATFFRYVGYDYPFPQEWVDDVKSAGGIPHIAWEPNQGLDEVVDNEYLRNFAKKINEAGVPIFIRFASEMNGTWCAYSGDPTKYIEKWKLVHDVLEEEAPNAIMMWSVFTFPEYTIMDYYPGDEYVDWVGVNIYNVVYHNDNIYEEATQEDPLRLLDFVYDNFSYKKPIHISEFGATNYTITDDGHHTDFAIEKIERMYSNLQSKYPRVKAISYFNVNNLINAPEGRKINDYSLTSKDEVLEKYSQLIQNEYFLSTHKETIEEFSETLSFNYRHFIYRGDLHVDLDFFTNNIGLELIDSSYYKATFSDGEKELTVPLVVKKMPRTFYNRYYTVNGAPFREVLEYFGYHISIDYDNQAFIVH